jgi:hypothetical protein
MNQDGPTEALTGSYRKASLCTNRLSPRKSRNDPGGRPDPPGCRAAADAGAARTYPRLIQAVGVRPGNDRGCTVGGVRAPRGPRPRVGGARMVRVPSEEFVVVLGGRHRQHVSQRVTTSVIGSK